MKGPMGPDMLTKMRNEIGPQGPIESLIISHPIGPWALI